MSTCGECDFYDSINGDKGNCKHSEAQRLIVPKESHLMEIINGWPVVNVDEKSCGEFVEAH